MNQSSRRKFLQKASLASLAVASPEVLAPDKNKELFIHHVLFYLKDKNNAQDAAKLLEGLHKLAKVKTIQYVHIGTPASTSRPVIVKDYSFSWMCFFKNIIEQELYQSDPIHLKFVEDYSHLWEKVVIYDSVGPKKVS
ncbi:stress responsive alpha/beta barrel protein [Dyadobacter jejuensis]|uniref:Stress responsive alpha/beta barrel protein n=1 Tax=Dyadobacter jejuensis TaxID=1082580 RepID=A0A316AM37_9BACT|nr:Dabb family protein [Dyadobacter jejuensis]PWJ58339.1 stress responsive alpha/beta barrel protein [Dyadobacter jejuensis]